MTRLRRPAPCAGRSRRLARPTRSPTCAGARPHERHDPEARCRRRGDLRDGAAPRAAAHRDDAPDAGARRAARATRTGRRPAGRIRSRPSPQASGRGSGSRLASLRWGADPGRFSYDNERPPHAVELGAYEIARHPVTAGMWMRFAQDGGYDRRSFGRRGVGLARGAGGHSGPVDRSGAPRRTRMSRELVRGRCVRPGARRAPAQRGRVGEGREARGEPLQDVGRVWEWTATCFGGYPGFVAYPYREYSEVFFGDAYRVLRGGSWATHPRVGTLTFRNWDLPQRRQIFAGLRLAQRRQVNRPGLPGLICGSVPATGRSDGAGHDNRAERGASDPHRLAPRRRRRALARGGRARRPHAAVQGASAEALLRLPRRGAVRSHLRAARVLPNARRANDPERRRRARSPR